MESGLSVFTGGLAEGWVWRWFSGHAGQRFQPSATTPTLLVLAPPSSGLWGPAGSTGQSDLQSCTGTEPQDGVSLGPCTVHPLPSQSHPKAIPAWRHLSNNTEPRQEEHELWELAQVRGQNSTGLGGGCGLNTRAWLNFLWRDNDLWAYLFIPVGKFLALTHSRYHMKHIIYYCISENNHSNIDNRNLFFNQQLSFNLCKGQNRSLQILLENKSL